MDYESHSRYAKRIVRLENALKGVLAIIDSCGEIDIDSKYWAELTVIRKNVKEILEEEER